MMPSSIWAPCGIFLPKRVFSKRKGDKGNKGSSVTSLDATCVDWFTLLSKRLLSCRVVSSLFVHCTTMTSTNMVPYHISSIHPRDEDFLFVKPGGKWQKVRQKRAWNSDRLHVLAIEYGKAGTHHKRDFVQTHIIAVVHQDGGRFLRGSEHERERVSWDVVQDQDWIEEELMRILRNMYCHNTAKGNDVQLMVVDMSKTLKATSATLAQLGTTMERLSGQKRPAVLTSSGNALPLSTARKLRRKLNALVKEVDSFQLLLQGGDNNSQGDEASEASSSTTSMKDNESSASAPTLSASSIVSV